MIHFVVVAGVVNSPEIPGNNSKSLEVIMSIIFIRIAAICGSRVKNELFFLNTMHKVKA